VLAPLRDKSLTGFAPKGILSLPRKRPEVLRGLPPLQAPFEVGYHRELLVNNEKFLTGQAVGLSNGVKDNSKMRSLPETSDYTDCEQITQIRTH